MIKGKLTSLRPLKKSDFTLIYRWINHPQVMPFWYGRDQLKSFPWVNQHFTSILTGQNPSACWIIEVNKKSIGFIYNTPQKNDDQKFTGQIELDILIGEVGKWHKGYGTDALKAMIDYCFTKQKAERVYIIPRQSNQRAIHVYQKAGLKKEGILRHFEKFEGKWIDSIMMSIIKPEWQNSK